MFFRRLFKMRPDDRQMWQGGRVEPCACLEPQYAGGVFSELSFHQESSTPGGDAQSCLEDLIQRAVRRGVKEFAPGLQMPPELWSQITMLPSSLGSLGSVQRLYLYSSHLVRIPPQIGNLERLEELDLYTSYRLHWLPYEVTRCSRLKRTRFSTRALYGNYKYRPPFPRLNTDQSRQMVATPECSVCRRKFNGTTHQAWISLRVGADVLPLLVNACSDDCLCRLPPPAANYVDHPHGGGLEVRQPG